MNLVLRRIEISGFRSLDNVKIIPSVVSVFTGMNDVGKSNILRALNLFFNGQTDPGTPVNFSADYSKLSLYKAQTSIKQKQQIKIRLYLNAPESFKSLHHEEQLWWERTYDREGKLTERSSLDGSPKKATLSRLINSIMYFYIPALKGPNVLEFLLGEIGKRNLLPADDIVDLNRKINNNIKDFGGILAKSSINIQTNFELPILVRDFWQRLNINTEFDEFSSINTLTSSKDSRIREEAYQISLLARGEGLKSKYVPPLLKWIQEHEPSKYFIWGIDEPENSLEFKKAQEVADLYFNEYSKNTQIFMTSHSLAFIFPHQTQHEHIIFRCIKTGKGDIEVQALDDLFTRHTKVEIAEELGALEIQKEVVEHWRTKEKEFGRIADNLHKLTKPVILVEGTLDKEYIEHTLELFGRKKNYKFDVQTVGTLEGGGNERSGGHTWLDKVWLLRHQFTNKTTVLFYDIDCNKQTQTEGKMTIFGPLRLQSQVYERGIEHFLTFPTSYKKENYMSKRKQGDNIIYTPNKNRIKAYVFNAPEPDRKKILQKLFDTLETIEKNYAP